MISIVLFLATCNTLFSFPLDKIIMSLFVIYFLCRHKINKTFFNIIILITFFLTSVFIINLLNNQQTSLIIFFPIIGFMFVYYVIKYIKIQEIKKSIEVHIIISIVYLIYGYLTRNDLHVHFLYDKGLPFLAAPMGFTATVQTFGTLLLAYIILTYRKDKKKNIFLYLSFILLIMTFNRVSYINLFFYSILKIPKLITYILLIILLFFLIKPEIIKHILGTFGTINSRLIKISDANYVIMNASIFHFFFGHSNSFITGNENIDVIENGIMQLLYTYGFMFLIILFSIVFIWLLFAKTKMSTRNKMYVVYIITIAQVFTHEYYSTSFYLILSILFLNNKIETPVYSKIRKIKKMKYIFLR